MGEQDVGGFGRYLRSVREARKLSLDAVEEMTLSYPGRVTKSHLSRIENGQAEATFPRMYALSQIYGLPISFLAERLEIDLRRQAVPAELLAVGEEELTEQIELLRLEGRHADALMRIELLIERLQGKRDTKRLDARLIPLRIRRISCLADLDRLAAAKDECEQMLALEELSPLDRVKVLYYFARCCHRMARHSIAMMAIAQIEERLSDLEDPRSMRAFVAGLKGNVHLDMGRPLEALVPLREAVDGFEALPDAFEACRRRVNLGMALQECEKYREARRQLQRALEDARTAGYHRQVAYALHGLGRLSFRQDDPAAAESYLLESNKLARQRDLASVVFCNCYYLWKIAEQRGDARASLSHRQSLRKYLGRVPDTLTEAREFRQNQAGGEP